MMDPTDRNAATTPPEIPTSIGIVGNLAKDDVVKHATQLRKLLLSRQVKVHLKSDLAEAMAASGAIRKEEGAGHDTSSLNQISDRLAIMGGDGTILNFFRGLPREHEPKPIVGVNLGRLGFLTSVGRDDKKVDLRVCLESAVKLLLQPGLLNFEPRSMLSVQIVSPERGTDETYTALNEVTFTRGRIPRLVELDCSIKGKLVSRYNADGLIIATPTGSTAYSLAAGGPILTPSLPVLVIAPICPHVLTDRPIVVDQDSEIRVKVCQTEGKDPHEVFVTVDGGEPKQITHRDFVLIKRSDWCARLAMPEETSFFEILRKKLKWGGSNV